MTDDNDRFTEHVTDDTPGPDQVASIEPVDVPAVATGPDEVWADEAIRQPAPTAPRPPAQTGETIDPWARAEAARIAQEEVAPEPAPARAQLPLETLAAEQAAQAPPPPHGYPFEWAGRTWRVRPQFDVRSVAALQTGDIGRAVGLLLGKDQAAELMAHDAPDGEAFTDEVLGAMIQVASGTTGITLPES